MKTLVMMIGLPGSGKSTIANRNEGQSLVLSTDEIHGELFGDENIQRSPDKVFETVKRRIVGALNGDCDTVVMDATNLRKKNRIPFIAGIRARVKADIEVVAHWVAVPYAECLKRDGARKRQVGADAIRKMYLNFAPPGYEEGFDGVEMSFNCTEEQMAHYTIDGFMAEAMVFDQRNHHHSLTLGGHCLKAMEYVKGHGGGDRVCMAAQIHDNGKLFTASFLDYKGEMTEEYHYYQHHCVGAYDSVFYTRHQCSCEDSVYIANLIYYHMHPLLDWKNNPAKQNMDTATMSQDFLKDLMLLHEGDMYAH